jgi:hypothetical protein
MNSPESLGIEAVVDDTERSAVAAAADQLGEALEAATGHASPVALRFRESLTAVGPPEAPTIVIASFLPDVERLDEPIAATEARWRDGVASLGNGFLGVFACTVFRCVNTNSLRRRDRSFPAITERIRRLNLLAAELSHDTGVGVIDIDRVFTHVGARELDTDYRLTGPMAADVAAHAIVSVLLAMALDEVATPDVQNRARHFHGDLATVVRYVMGRRQQGGSA